MELGTILPSFMLSTKSTQLAYFFAPYLSTITTEIFFFKNHAENEAVRLVPDLFLLFKKALRGKSKWSAA